MPDDLIGCIEEFQRCIEARDRNAAEQILDEEYALALVAPGPATMPRERWLEVLEHYVVRFDPHRGKRRSLTGSQGLTAISRAAPPGEG